MIGSCGMIERFFRMVNISCDRFSLNFEWFWWNCFSGMSLSPYNDGVSVKTGLNLSADWLPHLVHCWNQRWFPSPSSPNDSNLLSRFEMKVDIFQNWYIICVGVSEIFKTYVSSFKSFVLHIFWINNSFEVFLCFLSIELPVFTFHFRFDFWYHFIHWRTSGWFICLIW